MAEGRPDVEPTLIPFDVQRSDITIQVNFGAQFWPLFHNIPSLYSALLSRLKDSGVTAHHIRSDVGDGTLGAYNVNFWILAFRAQVRIRLENVEIQFNSITRQDVDAFERAFVALMGALTDAMREIQFTTYGVDFGLHGDPQGISTRDFLGRFISNVPDRLGAFIGAGVVFYFGEEAESPVRTVTADLSGAFPGKLYVRFYSLYKGTMSPETLRSAVERDATTGLESLGLRSKDD